MKRTSLLQENPYQVKNKRFRRTQNEGDDFTSLSQEKIITSSTISSSQKKKITKNDSHKQGQIAGQILLRSIEKSIESSPSKFPPTHQLRRKKDIQNENDSRQAYLMKLLNQRQKQIQRLESLLAVRQVESLELIRQNREYEIADRARVSMEVRLKEEMSRMETTHNEESYRLKQVIKKLQLDVDCLNRKWSLEYERMVKEKQLECRTLREKYTGLLRNKRLQNKVSILTQNMSTTDTNNQLLDFSSFQLSKDDGF